MQNKTLGRLAFFLTRLKKVVKLKSFKAQRKPRTMILNCFRIKYKCQSSYQVVTHCPSTDGTPVAIVLDENRIAFPS